MTDTPPLADESSMIAALRNRHPDRMGEWAFLPGVTLDTGGQTRTADALALNLWASRGMALHGYEVKVSRSDWLTELKDPAKADKFYTYCRYWTIAVPNVALTGKRGWGEKAPWERQIIVAPDELPAGWGLAVWNGTKWHNAVKAKAHEDAHEMPRRLMVAMIRRALQGGAMTEELKRERLAGYHEGREHGKQEGKREGRDRAGLVEELRETLREFETETGVTLQDFLAKWRGRWHGVPVETRVSTLKGLLTEQLAVAEVQDHLQKALNISVALARDIHNIGAEAGVSLSPTPPPVGGDTWTT